LRIEKNIQKQKLALDIFQSLNRAKTPSKAICEILVALKKNIGISAAAIRLKDNGDYPYFYYDGFNDIHIEMENSLCSFDETGKQLTDNYGDPLLACVCGRVLQEKIDSKLSYFTKGGSFWTNNSEKLLKGTSVEELGETRNVCNAEGYLSVALIPLRDSRGIIGLLQLNDESPDRFNSKLIEYLEGLGESIGIALTRIEEEQHRKRLEKEKEKLLHQYSLRIKVLDCLYRISKLLENQDLSTDEVLELIVTLLPSSTQHPEIAVAQLNIEDRLFSTSNYRDPEQRYSVLIQAYGVIVGVLVIGYIEKKPKEFKGPFLEDEVKLVNLVAETISRMLERKKTGEWRKSINKYALILSENEMRHITKLVLEDTAIGEMDREEYNIQDIPNGSTQTLESYMALQFNLELNRGLIIKLQNLLSADEPI
jgi:GAF domain-containing protein